MIDSDAAPMRARGSLVDRLPDELRIVLYLRIVERRSVAECARVLTMTEGQVLLTQHRALSVLRARLGTP
ncbi:sigma factor-like helix-turn-helix DNA-binding protein [Tsukamurella paurometabola]|uniref:RNA polymerase sigma factor SigD n=2 Tax=Tsukamurella paurometabola TaxID=2061 RepID=A0A3P8KEP1_TSUPA|nr:sigma factor-like helix-turn-helix DNA-binding protein [Tsukamurella paurometabola]UEA81326.1 RNA polymerase subunit sigma-70 [Tsukamurella paurometabola]VDR38308.1 RNA polymerase sigma factor SigD [Tsukamurella paurometabola]